MQDLRSDAYTHEGTRVPLRAAARSLTWRLTISSPVRRETGHQGDIGCALRAAEEKDVKMSPGGRVSVMDEIIVKLF